MCVPIYQSQYRIPDVGIFMVHGEMFFRVNFGSATYHLQKTIEYDSAGFFYAFNCAAVAGPQIGLLEIGAIAV